MKSPVLVLNRAQIEHWRKAFPDHVRQMEQAGQIVVAEPIPKEYTRPAYAVYGVPK